MTSRTGGNDGMEAWNLSVGATYGGWELSGAYMNVKPDNSLNEEAWTVGALYGIGPFQISADYRDATRRPFIAAALKERAQRGTLQTAYKLGPGIVVGLAAFYGEQTDAAGGDWSGGGATGGIKIDF
jgi:predicted porin